ncbi:MAG: bifunctional allantoicase/(S)-ureidoglycine aminohydrolase [Pseudomonadota bacterium]
MPVTSYAAPPGGMPPPGSPATGRAVFTDAFAVIPADVQRDIVTSFLPGWSHTRAWVLARPLSGFAETFSWYAVAMDASARGAGEPEPGVEGVIFVCKGAIDLDLGGEGHRLGPGGYAYLGPDAAWTVASADGAVFQWVRKRYVPGDCSPPDSFVTRDQDVPPVLMDPTGTWATTRFVDPTDLRHDCHVNIVSFEPGGAIPFAETHVMEHGIYVLEGQALYLLNQDWVEVGPGDFLWLRAFCPQACVAKGPGRFRYLLYKDVNRHAVLP